MRRWYGSTGRFGRFCETHAARKRLYQRRRSQKANGGTLEPLPPRILKNGRPRTDPDGNLFVFNATGPDRAVIETAATMDKKTPEEWLNSVINGAIASLVEKEKAKLAETAQAAKP